MFTRSQFDIACKAYAHRYSQWTWIYNPRVGYGYLFQVGFYRRMRTAIIPDADCDPLRSEDDLEIEDIASAPPTAEMVTVQQYIVYAASFNVPVFYFTMHDSNGSPLPLAEVTETGFFKTNMPTGVEQTSYGLTSPDSSFPLLSQGYHPTLDTPSWYLHPCETDKAVGEFMAEEDTQDWSEERRYVRWMELWLMIVQSVLNVG